MKWIFRKYLLKFTIALLAIYIATTTVKSFLQPIQQPRIIQQMEPQAKHEYIIDEQMIKSKLHMKSQIVSLKQSFDKKDTYIDSTFLGERDTQLNLHGTYQFGLNTKDIRIEHIDQDSGTVYVKLGKPILISLELPYDKLDFSKTKGWLRLAATEDEQKNIYKIVSKNTSKEISNDKDVIKQANLHNQEVVKDILMKIQDVNYIVFE